MKEVYNLKNVWLLKKHGNLTFCGKCNQIVGCINPKGYTHLKLNFVCNCDAASTMRQSIEIAREKQIEYLPVNKAPEYRDRKFFCKECGMPLFNMMEERVINYWFHIKCVCGAEYDTKPIINKRILETINAIRDKKPQKD